MRAPSVAFACCCALLLACEPDYPAARRSNRAPPQAVEEAGGAGEEEVKACVAAQTPHLGLGNRALHLGWARGEVARQDLGRPLKAKSIEKKYERIFGAVPSKFAVAASAIEASTPAWYSRPELGALAINALYNAAYDAALTKLSPDAAFQQMPTDASAKQFCAAKAREAWLRVPTTEQISECAALATTDSVNERNEAEGTSTATPALERWAYVWALIVTAPPAITK